MPDAIQRLRDNVQRVFLGNSPAVDRIICCLLSRGHLLIEDVPGVGKTVLANAIARSIHCSFSRIQLTPDMLPGDVLGVSIFDRETGEFTFKRGPIFANIVLADEINRTTPRTQTALLEAMSEASVSIDGVVHRLDQPFMVLATQNPYEFEGTYPLPENQLDRFLMRVRLGYPAPEDERRILELRPATTVLESLKPAIDKDELLHLQSEVDRVRVDPALLDYVVEFANATRRHDRIQIGLSPRGSLALTQAARATALFRGRDYAVPEDILDNVTAVCAHRIITRTYLGAAPEAAEDVLTGILETLQSPA
ncbi:MAG: AAA family ATPase [Leptolyngbya sp. PLA2]|nr:AAA family ATPase [Leptolyngbya sp. PL-A2]MCQ3941010.1 ATPase [cyanobacterium CYA1]MCZ7633116.1 AAA family ATPase [Phycisphaerales bacterium]MDL1905603.1 AAA family ATPase [Synechococcales cyanobacterium CNB]GIK18826.1 MAG: ATPase [Planctomycetota bacterium]